MDRNAPPATAAPSCYRFGELTLDLRTRKLFRGPEAIPLSKLTYELLRVLVEAAPNVVTRDELVDRVWGPRRIVTPENLAQRLLTLRRALGDDAARPAYIEGIRGYGYRLIPPVERVDDTRSEAEAPPAKDAPAPAGTELAPRGAAISAVGALLAAVLLGLGYALITLYPYPAREAPQRPAAPVAPTAGEAMASPAVLRSVMPSSVAVLPFRSIRGDASTDEFATGIHVEILYQLSQVDGINVIARTSVQRYEDTDLSVQEIAAELGVGAVLEGTVRYEGERARVTAELIDPETMAPVWAETYEYDLGSAFEVQTAIAAQIVDVLVARLAPAERERAVGARSVRPAAYALYLEALQSLPQFAQVIAHLDRALALDRDFAQAHGLKAMIVAYSIMNSFRRADLGITLANQEAFESVALEHAARALAVDSSTGMAWLARALIHQYRWRWQEAADACRQALDASPNDPRVLVLCARLEVVSGDRDEALRMAQRARYLDPNSAETNFQYGLVARFAGRPELAIDALLTAIRLAPASVLYNAQLGNAYAGAGDRDEAEQRFRMAEELVPRDAAGPIFAFLSYGYSRVGLRDDARRVFAVLEGFGTNAPIGAGGWAMAYLAVGEVERALGQLALAVDKARSNEPDAGFFILMVLKANLYDDATLNEPRFRALLEQLGP